MTRIGKERNLNDEDINFSYNGTNIDKHDDKKISHPDFNMIDNSTIRVIDPNNKIGRTYFGSLFRFSKY